MPDSEQKTKQRHFSVGLYVSAAVFSLALLMGAYYLGARTGHANKQANKNTARLAENTYVIHQICVAVNNLNSTITASLLRNRRNLPRLTYYREHPGELRIARAEIDATLRTFRPRRC